MTLISEDMDKIAQNAVEGRVRHDRKPVNRFKGAAE